MTDRIFPATRPDVFGRWFIVALTVIGLLGQVALQGLSLPGDTPRATIFRLTGVDIGGETPPAVAHHHHHHAGMVMKDGQGHQSSGSHHTHDAACALCPLLVIAGFILAAPAFLPSVSVLLLALLRRTAQPRAPPLFVLFVPPSRGPPLSV